MKRWIGIIPLLLCLGCATGSDALVSQPSDGDENGFDVVSPELGESTGSGGQQVALASAESRSGFMTTRSGLKFRIIENGKGRRPNKNSTVTAHYRGWLDDGTEFDSSYKRGRAMSFSLSGVVEGWTEGLQLIQEGGKIELEIPSDLGYGPAGRPPTIPGGATLHFEIELIKVR